MTASGEEDSGQDDLLFLLLNEAGVPQALYGPGNAHALGALQEAQIGDRRSEVGSDVRRQTSDTRSQTPDEQRQLKKISELYAFRFELETLNAERGTQNGKNGWRIALKETGKQNAEHIAAKPW
ncbi:MAG: hypothetical protein V5B78_01990 [Desulfohalobiaceae bacterium]